MFIIKTPSEEEEEEEEEERLWIIPLGKIRTFSHTTIRGRTFFVVFTKFRFFSGFLKNNYLSSFNVMKPI